VRNWKRRYFKLKNKTLFYYKSKESIVPIGYILLNHFRLFDAEEKMKRENCVELRHEIKRCYFLQAENKSILSALVWEFKKYLIFADPFFLEKVPQLQDDEKKMEEYIINNSNISSNNNNNNNNSERNKIRYGTLPPKTPTGDDLDDLRSEASDCYTNTSSSNSGDKNRYGSVPPAVSGVPGASKAFRRGANAAAAAIDLQEDAPFLNNSKKGLKNKKEKLKKKLKKKTKKSKI